MNYDFFFLFRFVIANASLPFLALKKSYVDVFNPSGAPAKAEPIMAPTVPMPSIPQSGGYFVPGAVPTVGSEVQTQQLDVSIVQKWIVDWIVQC